MPETYNSRERGSSFTTMPPSVLANSRHVSEEDIQIALAPYIQTYLSQSGRRHSCCSVTLPVAFERAAPNSWFDPRFDSCVLEGQYQASVFPQIRLRFRFTLLYILLCSVIWMSYFLTDTGPSQHRVPISISFGLISCTSIGLLWLTYSQFYRAYILSVSGCTACIICILSLVFLICTGDAFSPLGHFAICVELVLLIYTVIPLRLWQNISIAVIYSIAFELVTHFLYTNNHYTAGKTKSFGYRILLLRFLLHFCVHLVGAHVLVMNVVRMRGTFMKVGQNLLVRRQLEMEKQLKEKMIHSVMPPKVADLLLKESGSAVDRNNKHHHHHSHSHHSRKKHHRSGGGGGDDHHHHKRHYQSASINNDVKSLFRPFHMHSMENVSILFADIVGFTRMSSTKSAEQLVEILNDLFERFDDLCMSSGCEKISTLGDCYYCVSGCPEPRSDHAVCCVEMGLGMILAMRLFDAQRQENVKMRVGVHTGTVLCGIVGTRRVKFDVWSNDVTLANKMESSGRPEQVHISEKTRNFLGENYSLEEGEQVDGYRTYFVLGRLKMAQTLTANSTYNDLEQRNSLRLMIPPHGGYNGFVNGVQLSQSATNVSTIHPSVPPASPVGQISASLNPSPILSTKRPRIASFNKVTKYLISNNNSDEKTQQQQQKSKNNPPPKMDFPKIIISTRSLPESLCSDNDDDDDGDGDDDDDDDGIDGERGNGDQIDGCHRENSTSSKLMLSLRQWRMPKFLRKLDDSLDDQKTTKNQQSNCCGGGGGGGGGGGLGGIISCSGSHNCLNCNNNSTISDNSNCSKNKKGLNVSECGISVAPSSEETVPCLEQNGGSGGGVGGGGDNGCGGTKYHQLPIVIETLCSSAEPSSSCTINQRNNKLDVPAINVVPSLNWSGNGRSPENSSISPGPPSIFDEIIDVRSYISQSRSDISPFGRSASQSGRTQHCGGGVGETSSPSIRPRGSSMQYPPTAATTITGTTLSSSSAVISPTIHNGHSSDILSICPSAHSRKDSGIRSNSRRSSIQQQIYVLNQSAISHQRVSGYFTSSQSSLEEIPKPVSTPNEQNPDPLGACLQQLRKQSDLQLIRCVRDNAKSQRSYLVKPPLSNISLFFKSRQMEREFRGNAHRFGCEIQYEAPPTLATPKYNTYIDILVGMLVYFVISASLFLLAYSTESESKIAFRIWASLFVLFSIAQFFSIFFFTKQICHFNSYNHRRHTQQLQQLQHQQQQQQSQDLNTINSSTTATVTGTVTGGSATTTTNRRSCDDILFDYMSKWYPWHVFLSFLMSLPVILIIIQFSLQDFAKLEVFEYHYGFLIFVCIIHFCNFTQLNCWMRNILAVLTALAFVGIALGQLGAISSFKFAQNDLNSQLIINNNNNNNNNNMTTMNIVNEFINVTYNNETIDGTIINNEKNISFSAYHVEIYLDLLLVLILVWFLNREFEIGYRLTFYGNAVANKDKISVENMKNQADMLLHNIIPKHVAEHLKNTAKYSENHHNVAILFASIVNFNELYDESYLGGKEYLRVLNELIADFDELLIRPEFWCVEKIKTIGSTFMAASGLDPSTRSSKNDNDHIIALMDFAIAMQFVVDDFNKDLLEFNLVLRIGFNVGDVTAGVIGTSKLHYDIWGDAVNVASRMDTTGVAGRIQVGKSSIPLLESRFEFEGRGQVYVKGKDNMEVFLVKLPNTIPSTPDDDDPNDQKLNGTNT